MLDKRRIIFFLCFSFGIAWASALVIYLTGGIVNSPEIAPGTGLTLALALMAGVYMMAPSIANLLTRLVTKEGMREAWIRPNFRRNRIYWAAGWVMPAVLTIAGGAFFFLLFPKYYDASLTLLMSMIPAGSATEAMNPWVIVGIQTFQAVMIAPLLNSVATFGEEFGWRGYLQPKLMVLGAHKAMLWMGVIWGVWHWPVIAMGHNYGLNYPGYPWLGMLGMVLFCTIGGTLLGWISWRAGSVWPAVIGHAAINGIAALPSLFVKGTPLALLGPLPVGVIPLLIWALPAGYLLLKPHLFDRAAEVEVFSTPAATNLE